jgi:hypothetical protein
VEGFNYDALNQRFLSGSIDLKGIYSLKISRDRKPIDLTIMEERSKDKLMLDYWVFTSIKNKMNCREQIRIFFRKKQLEFFITI